MEFFLRRRWYLNYHLAYDGESLRECCLKICRYCYQQHVPYQSISESKQGNVEYMLSDTTSMPFSCNTTWSGAAWSLHDSVIEVLVTCCEDKYHCGKYNEHINCIVTEPNNHFFIIILSVTNYGSIKKLLQLGVSEFHAFEKAWNSEVYKFFMEP